MSALYGSMQGDDRSVLTCRGHREATAHIRGRDHGIRVDATRDRESGEVVIKVHQTGGSNNTHDVKHLGTLTPDGRFEHNLE